MGQTLSNLAKYLGDRGDLLRQIGKLGEAFEDHNKAVAIFTQLVERDHQKCIAHSFAMSLGNRGDTLAKLGMLDEAIADYDAAVAILAPLVEREGQESLANDLAELRRKHDEILRRQSQEEAIPGLMKPYGLVH